MSLDVTVTFNALIIKNLETIYDYHKYITNNAWKSKAYLTAINIIKSNHNNSITHIDDLTQFHCLSKNMIEKLSWIIENNKNLPEVDDICDDLQSIRLLASVHNIGSSKAVSLVKNGIKTIDELRKNTHLLNELQKNGLNFHEHIMQRIPRDEMHKHNTFIEKIIDKYHCLHTIHFEITGSYRRNEDTSGDIDILLCPKQDSKKSSSLCREFVNILRQNNYIPDNGIFASGTKKFMGMCKLDDFDIYRRIDIITTTPKEFPFMLLYFTGNSEFNVKMREIAKSKGFLLNEQGLFDVTSNVNVNKVEGKFDEEQDIFKFLGIEYVEPSNRYLENIVLSC